LRGNKDLLVEMRYKNKNDLKSHVELAIDRN